MLEEICGIFWGGFYGIYCLCMCGTCCKEEYEARIKKRERIINEYDRISNLIKKFGLKKLNLLDYNRVLEFINADKKNMRDQLNYIL